MKLCQHLQQQSEKNWKMLLVDVRGSCETGSEICGIIREWWNKISTIMWKAKCQMIMKDCHDEESLESIHNFFKTDCNFSSISRDSFECC